LSNDADSLAGNVGPGAMQLKWFKELHGKRICPVFI